LPEKAARASKARRVWWSAILSAINLTDKQYYIAKISSAVPFGTVDGMPGAPREVVLTVKRKF
jgi:outer membrane receptor for monomeric catechols